MVNTFALALGAIPLAFAQSASVASSAASSIISSNPNVVSSPPASIVSSNPNVVYPPGASVPSGGPYGVNTTFISSPTGTSTGGKSSQTVQVGGPNGLLRFIPDIINAAPGSDVTFVFNAKNHSIVSADFSNPCNPAANNPIFAGFNFATNSTSQNTFTINVKDDKPIWLYCPQLKPMPHCPQGMVAVINQPKSGPNTLDTFRTAAAGKSTSTIPQGGISGGSVQSGVPNSNGGGASGTSTGGPAQQTSSGAGEILARGGVVGGILGFLVALML